MSPSVYHELVKVLFTNSKPILIIGFVYAVVCGLIAARAHDISLYCLVICGAIAAVWRIAVMVVVPANVTRTDSMARTWERRYGFGSYAFALLLGLTGARIVALHDLSAEMLVVGVIFGYGSGVICRLATRPQIAMPSLLLASLPVIAEVSLQGSLDQIVLSGLITIFMLGSIDTLRHLYRVSVSQLTAERVEAERARRDPLTGLPNRLAVTEHLAAMLGEGARVAVHFLDLDRFKDANDSYGHAAGDALLCAVGERLSVCIEPGDMVARLGGDEFMVVQIGIAHESQAEMLALRIVQSIQPPFDIAEHQITIGTSVGVALSLSDGCHVPDLMARADEALYLVKTGGRNGFALYAMPNLVPLPVAVARAC